MQLSADGLDLIRKWESFQPVAYQDTGGVWTIGYGHTQDVRPGDVIDVAQANELLREDCRAATLELERRVRVSLNQCQIDALISFEFNTGGLWIGRPARPSRVLAAVNEWRWNDAVEELLHWNMDNGVPLRGLLLRRLEEGLLFARDPWPPNTVAT